MIHLHDVVKKYKEMYSELGRDLSREEFITAGISDWAIRKYGGIKGIKQKAAIEELPPPIPEELKEPKILLLDIETSPLIVYTFDLFDQNIGLNQILRDWYVMSWSAKWLGSPPEQIMYADCRENIGDDTGLLSQIWQLIDEADIIIGQNSKRFDEKKLMARFIIKGFPPPSSYRSVDTLEVAKRVAKFTSNKLAYTTDKLCTKFKKLDHGKYAGFELWRACEAGDEGAWTEMAQYNRYDVLSLEEYYLKLRPFDKKHPNLNVFSDSFTNKCLCGSVQFTKHNRPAYENRAIYDRYICNNCGAEYKDKSYNLLSKEKRSSLKELIL
jgi:hypothetical protein